MYNGRNRGEREESIHSNMFYPHGKKKENSEALPAKLQERPDLDVYHVKVYKVFIAVVWFILPFEIVSHYVAQCGLKLMIFLTQPLSAGMRE
jgi:hypothetical protein